MEYVYHDTMIPLAETRISAANSMLRIGDLT